MITVHHLNNSRSQRVLWLLEELGVPYQVKRYERDPKTMLAPPALKAVHPLGKSPVISDGDVTVAESGAITEYLVDTYGRGRLAPPLGSRDRLRYTYWLHYAEGSAMPPLLLKLVFSTLPKRAPLLMRPLVKAIAKTTEAGYIDPQLKTHLDYLEGELTKTAWFAGDDFSAADIQMSFPIEAFAMRGGLDASRPKLWAYLQRIHSRAAYRAAIEKGGPYSLLGDA
ncbi:MAG: gst [Rhizobacter sp.]|jgi:glutathione S-transferase|nr:gst [Rhizobacter sp.]